MQVQRKTKFQNQSKNPVSRTGFFILNRLMFLDNSQGYIIGRNKNFGSIFHESAENYSVSRTSPSHAGPTYPPDFLALARFGYFSILSSTYRSISTWLKSWLM